MTSYLAVPDPELDRLVKKTPPGMMYWSGTCSDPTATCGKCRYFGYEVDTHKYPAGCALFHSRTRQHRKPLPPDTLACKYFEPR